MDETHGQIGPYRLVDRLGQGAQGAVYRARHCETATEVALKVLTLTHPGESWRVRREVHALRAVQHRNVVRVLDQDDGRGQPWYAMELIEGPDLVTHCRGDATSVASTPLDASRLSQALRSFVPVTEALAYLHQQGIVHRDLKPSNVLVTCSDGDARPVILDLGLALRLDGPLQRERLGPEGRSGTLAFMAPEQLRGETADARTDLFALGCLLYLTITGRLPFPTIREALAEDRHPVALSAANPGAPATLDRLVSSLLSKSRHRRLPGADLATAALVQSLDALESHAGVGARPSRRGGRAVVFRADLVGRSAQADALTQWLAASLDASSGGLVALEGPSGIGKTRLANAVARRLANRGVRVIAGECREAAAPLAPLLPALDALAEQVGELPADQRDSALRGALERLAPLTASLSAWAPGTVDRSPLSPLEAQRAIHQALWTALAWLAARRPLVLAIDDIQWADELTLGWLSTSLETGWLSRWPLAVVATARLEQEGERVTPLLQHRSARRLVLARLSAAEVAEMLAQMLGGEVPAPFVERLAAASSGNPLYISEYARAAVERGALRREVDGLRVRWRLAADKAADASLPGSLEALIADRLSRLPAGVRAVAESLSVLRPAASPSLLYEVAEVSAADGSRAVQSLLTAAVIVETEAGDVRFDHQRVETVVYDSIAASRRSRLHRLAAAAIEGSGAAQSADGAEAVARHWERGEEPDRARPRYLTAARLAATAYALSRARSLYEAYLRLSATPSVERAAARGALGRDVLLVLGETDAAEAVLREALDEAQALRADETAAEVLFALGRLLRQSGRVDAAEAAWLQAAAIEEQTGRLGPRAALAVQLGRIHLHRGAVDEARASTQRALELHQHIDDPAGQADAFVNLALLEQVQSRSAGSQLLELARRGYEKADDQLEAGRTLVWLGNCAFHAQRWSEAVVHYEAALATGRQIGDRAMMAASLGNLAGIRRREGRYDVARRAAEESLIINRDIGNRPNVASALVQLATVERRLGRLEAAIRHLEEAASLKEAIGDGEGYSRVTLSLVWTYVAGGDLDQARRYLDEAVHRFEARGPRSRARWALAEGLVGLAQGDVDGAIVRLQAAVDLLDEEDWATPQMLALTVLAQGHLRRGALDAAGLVLEKAQRIVEEVGDPYWGGHVDLGIARWCRFAIELDRARAHAERAHRTFERLGAPLGLAVAFCELGHLELIQDRPASQQLDGARAAVASLDLSPRSGAAGAIARLESAQLAALAGRSLVAGECA